MSIILDGSASVTINSGAVLGLTSATAQASTSGTIIDFTGIPSWAKRITVMFNGVSTNGTSNIQIQLGSLSGGIETTSYVSTITIMSTGVVTGAITTGMGVVNTTGATDLLTGLAVMANISSNVWTYASTINKNTAATAVAGGSKSLSSTLDRVRITTVNGTDTFDAGSINIIYE